jgi:ABC-type uncharacterized transport system ATPase subunit
LVTLYQVNVAFGAPIACRKVASPLQINLVAFVVGAAGAALTTTVTGTVSDKQELPACVTKKV